MDSLYNETLKDKFTLSPLQKYQKYGRWPYKFILGCLLVFLTSVQAIYISDFFAYNSPHQMKQWVYLFLNDDDPNDNVVDFLTLDDFQESLTSTIDNLASLNDFTIQKVSTEFSSIQIYVSYAYPYKAYHDQQLSFHYKIHVEEGITQPFNLTDKQSIKDFWHNANAFTLQINNITVYQDNDPICWSISIQYIQKDYSYIQAEINSIGGICSKKLEHPKRLLQQSNNDTMQLNTILKQSSYDSILLQMAIFILASIDLILNVKYIYEVIEMYTRNIYKQTRIRNIKVPEYKLKKDANLTTLKIILKEQRPWDQLSFREKTLFFDFFLPLRILGNAIQIIASAVIIAQSFTRVDDLSAYDELLVGLGVFLAWFSMVKYLEYHEDLHIIASVLESSIIPLCTATINFLPIFFAYAFLGICLFSESSRFNNIQSATTTLIALIYGDSISDIILQTSKNVNLTLTVIYIISYTLFFIFAVNNIMIALIREQQEQRKDLMQMEKELMNELDIKPSEQSSQQQQKFGDLPQFEMMRKTVGAPVVDIEGRESRKHLTFKSITNLAILLNKKDKKVSQNVLERDWKRIQRQEIQKNYIYNAMISTVQEIKILMSEIEKDVIKKNKH